MPEISELQVGDRIRCTGPLNDGSLGINRTLIDVEGTVTCVGQFESPITSWVGVDWANGSKLNLLLGDPFEFVGFQVDGPVVGPCEMCGAAGDVECDPACENKEFRDAEFDGVIEHDA